MDTYCNKCKTPMSLEQYKGLDRCPQCGFDFNRNHYLAAVSISVSVAGSIWLFGRRYGNAVFAVAAAFLTMGAVTVIGDIILRAAGVAKPTRRSIIGWVSVLGAVGVAAIGKLLL